MRVVIGVDHGGFPIKDRIISHIKTRELEITDKGVFSAESVDYPDVARAVCTALIEDHFDLAILACGTGIGISIAANKCAGVRCALIHDLFTAEMARAHNHANAIAFGGRIDYRIPIEALIDRFLDTRPEAGRHNRRVEKISLLES